MHITRLSGIVVLALLASVAGAAQKTETALTALSAAIDNCLGRDNLGQCYLRPLDDSTIGALFTHYERTAEPTGTPTWLSFQTFDKDGALKTSVGIVAASEEANIYDPTFVVAPNKDVHIFWHTGIRQYVLAAVVDAKGKLKSKPEVISGVEFGGPFIADCSTNRIVGIASDVISPCGGSAPACIHAAMTLDHKLITRTVPMPGFSPHDGDDVALDSGLRLHWAFRNLFEGERNEDLICYKLFDPEGKVIDERVVAHVPRLRNRLQRVVITVDSGGAAQVYFMRAKQNPKVPREYTAELQHFEVRPKTPVKGSALPLVLTIGGMDQIFIEPNGKQRKIARHNPK